MALEFSTQATSWGGPDAEAYADYTWVDSYIMCNKYAYSEWTDATTPQREAAIRQATRDIDSLVFTGEKMWIYQRLQFPRARDMQPYGIPYTMTYSMYPDLYFEQLDIKQACAEQAYWIVKNSGLNEHIERRMNGIVGASESVASISESYSYGGVSMRVCPDAYEILKKYLGYPTLVRR